MKKLTLAPQKSRGFALVATLMLLLLLLVIAIGLLNISAITLRTSSQNQAQAEARANARLALMIAMGELQKELGPDQRISANGAVLDDPSTLPNEVIHPNWSGVWDSWIAGPLVGAPTNAAYPCAESHHQTIGNQPDASMRPDYTNKSKHFRRWLLSLDPTDASKMDSSRSLALNGMPMPAATETAIRLVGEGSLGKTAPGTDFVSARLIDVKATSPSGGRGRYGWWVGDESQKARVMNDSYLSTVPANSAEKIFRGQSPGSTGTNTIKDLDGITAPQDAKLKGLPTLKTLDLVTNDPAKQPAKQPMPHIRDTDTHKLRLGMTTMITLWNPNNLPLVMDAHQILRFSTPPFGIRWRKHRSAGGFYDYRWSNLSYASANSAGGAATGQNSGFCLLRLSFAKTAAQRVVFAPGEVKVFSLPSTSGGTLTKAGNAVPLVSEGTNMDTINGWDPFGFFLMPNSTPQGPYADEAPEAYDFDFSGRTNSECMVFNPNDSISLSIDTEDPATAMAGNWRDGRLVAGANEIKGAGFNLYMLDEGYQSRWQDAVDFLRHYTMISRHGNSDAAVKGRVSTFYKELMTPGFPGGVAPIDFTSSTNSILGSQIIGASGAGEVISLMEFSLSIGCETGSNASGGFGGGRRIASRPFLHSSSSAGPFIDQNNKPSLYNYGWDWQLGKVNTIEDSIVTAEPGTGRGFYGGGYTIENGTTHAVQREIPVLPVISMASLSHAHLGGFSLGYANIAGDNPDTDALWFKSSRIANPIGVDYQKTGATGQAGLAPHVVQAVGNSYAHPNIPPDKAYTTWKRLFDEDAGEGEKLVPFADHSYLANKALWDEYFFSSMSPQPSKVELFGGSSHTAKQVADEFFFGSGSSLLPNRRMLPNKNNLDQAKLDALFTQANSFSNGLADKIASYLMVDGAFNVNSTSVDAWKVLFSSLRGKPVAYLESGTTPLESISTDKTAVNPGMLPNEKPVSSSAISSPNKPKEQWKTGRELSDTEIGELAEAMVKQVKLRGPFLSMSEFINRRLDGSNTKDMALKGALQAALDDPAVSINAQFRTTARKLDDEVAGAGFIFPDAAKGPIAYGSQPYVDQADILRGLAEQLTPRGDTFVIRTYGDSIDAQGNVVARAWCEAVVQRVPEYVNAADEPHLKHSDSALSAQSKQFGRKIQIVSFRWVNSSEI